MTGGLGTNPHLPGTTGILGIAQHSPTHSLDANTITIGLALHCTLDYRHLPRDLIVIFSTIKHCVAILPAAAGSSESIAHPMNTLPAIHRLVGKASIDLTLIVVAIHWSSPLVDTMGWQTVVMSLEITSWVVVKSFVVEMGSRQSLPIHLLSLAEEDHCC
jgi:hypothetical protein